MAARPFPSHRDSGCTTVLGTLHDQSAKIRWPFYDVSSGIGYGINLIGNIHVGDASFRRPTTHSHCTHDQLPYDPCAAIRATSTAKPRLSPHSSYDRNSARIPIRKKCVTISTEARGVNDMSAVGRVL